jgi:predicted MPP superfamily phosphohydrolase
LGAGTAFYAHNIEPGWVEVTQQRIPLPRLGNAFNGYRLVQISDIHADNGFMNEERLRNIVNMVNEQHADVIVITGDFVTDYLPGLEKTLAVLSKLRAKDGVFGILGNHDHPAGVEWVRECLRLGQVRELSNAVHTLRRGDQMLHLVGMDDLWPENDGVPAPVESHLPLLNQLTASLPAEGAAILLVHEPDFAEVAATNERIGLQLSGHSHGGQVRIPLHGPIFLPPLSRKYPMGLYHIKNMLHYTNRGIGVLSAPIRFDCRPEIAVMDLYGS